MFRLTASLILGLLAVLPHFVSAQDLSERGRFELMGVVTDVGTDEPVAGATVSVVELNRRATTDSLGQFRIDDVMEGRWTFRTGAFGYFDNVERSVVAEGYALVVGLAPAPFELEGLDVTTETTGTVAETSLAALDRSFTARSNRVGVSGDVTQRARLEMTSAPSILELLRDEYGVRTVQCPGQGGGGPGGDIGGGTINLFEDSGPEHGCIFARGRPRLLRVFIDDIDVAAPAFTLSVYRPVDLYRVEWYNALGQVHLYTYPYAMTLARTGRAPPPVCLVC